MTEKGSYRLFGTVVLLILLVGIPCVAYYLGDEIVSANTTRPETAVALALTIFFELVVVQLLLKRTGVWNPDGKG